MTEKNNGPIPNVCSHIETNVYQDVLDFISSNILNSVSIVVHCFSHRTPKFECSIILKKHFTLPEKENISKPYQKTLF